MATAQAIINRALRSIGALSEGGTPSVARSIEALDILNTLLDSWRLDTYLIYAEKIVIKVLTVNKPSYTIGPSSADISADRPEWLAGAYLTISGIDYPPLDPLTDDQYAAIPLKTVSSIPNSINFAATYPNATIFLYPQPAGSYTLNLRLPEVLQEFASLTTDYAMPKGHRRALELNLALELAPSDEKEPSAMLVQQARDAKALVKSAALRNTDPPNSVIEIAGFGGSGRWNFNTGDYR